jgi:hypothetical protein
MKTATRTALAAAMAIIAACSTDGRLGTQPPDPTASLRVTPGVDTLSAGDTMRFATLRDSGSMVLGDSGPVTWTVSDSRVAGIEAQGPWWVLVRALHQGTTLVTAVHGGGTASAVLVVNGGRLAFSGQPSDETAGVAFTPSVAVTIEDPSGQPLTSATNVVTVALGTNPVGATLSGTMTVTAVNGVATFGDLSINRGGRGYTLTASSAGFTHAISVPFAIVGPPGPPTHLSFSLQPSNTAAGATITPPPQITALDASGNVATAFTGNVTLALLNTNPLLGDLLLGTTSVAAVNGVATFANVHIDRAAAGYALSATAGDGFATVTSSAFSIMTGPVSATQSLISAFPSSILMGTGLSVIQVIAMDALKNPIAGATVTLAATGSGNTLTQPGVPTDGGGGARGSLSSSVPETKTVSATINGTAIAQTATVAVGVVSASQSTVGAAPDTILAGWGWPQSTIVVIARDAHGNPLSGATVVLAATGSGNTVTQPLGTIDWGPGVAMGTLSSSVAGTKTVSATINGTAITQTARVVVEEVSAVQSTVSAAPASFAIPCERTFITVTARDAAGTPRAGGFVVLTATGTGNTLSQPSEATLDGGVVTGSLSSTVAETKTVSATINGTAIVQTATVTVTPGPPSQLCFTVQPVFQRAGFLFRAQVAATDASGHLASGFSGPMTVAIGANPNGGILSGNTTVPAVNGVATFALSIDWPGSGYGTGTVRGYTLKAAASGFTEATSAPFTIYFCPLYTCLK